MACCNHCGNNHCGNGAVSNDQGNRVNGSWENTVTEYVPIRITYRVSPVHQQECGCNNEKPCCGCHCER